jgi:hypothetical protein
MQQVQANAKGDPKPRTTSSRHRVGTRATIQQMQSNYEVIDCPSSSSSSSSRCKRMRKRTQNPGPPQAFTELACEQPSNKCNPITKPSIAHHHHHQHHHHHHRCHRRRHRHHHGDHHHHVMVPFQAGGRRQNARSCAGLFRVSHGSGSRMVQGLAWFRVSHGSGSLFGCACRSCMHAWLVALRVKARTWGRGGDTLVGVARACMRAIAMTNPGVWGRAGDAGWSSTYQRFCRPGAPGIRELL